VRRPRRIAQARGLIARGQFEQSFQGSGGRAAAVHTGMGIADFGEAPRHGEHGKVGRVAVGHLIPGKRRRDARIGQGADGVGRAGRPILGILVVVEEDAVALFLPPLRCRQRREPALDGA
jgi:hypothetical protein